MAITSLMLHDIMYNASEMGAKSVTLEVDKTTGSRIQSYIETLMDNPLMYNISVPKTTLSSTSGKVLSYKYMGITLHVVVLHNINR